MQPCSKYRFAILFLVSVAGTGKLARAQDLVSTSDCDKFESVQNEMISFSSVVLPGTNISPATENQKYKGPNFLKTRASIGSLDFLSYEILWPGNDKEASCTKDQKKIISELRKTNNEFQGLFQWFVEQTDPRHTREKMKEMSEHEKWDPSLIDFQLWTQVIDNRANKIPKTAPAYIQKAFISEEIDNICINKYYNSNSSIAKDPPVRIIKSTDKNKFLVLNPILDRAGCHIVSEDEILSAMRRWKQEILESKWSLGNKSPDTGAR